MGAGAQHKGGGGFDDVDVEITDIRTDTYQMENKAKEVVASGVVGALIEFTNLENTELKFEDRYSAGGKVVPSDDGECFEAKGDDDHVGVADNTRWAVFSANLKQVGVPDALYAESVKELIGLKGHIRRIKPPESCSFKEIGVFTKLISLPGGSSGEAADPKIEASAVKLVVAVVTKYGETPKVELGQLANKAFKTSPNAAKIVAMVLDSKWLKTQQGWAFDGRSVNVAGADDSVVEV